MAQEEYARPIWILEDEAVCANCIHYRKHYGKAGEKYFPINAGHCVYPRIKDRKPGNTCLHFESKYIPFNNDKLIKSTPASVAGTCRG